jgi:hypothetical protein
MDEIIETNSAKRVILKQSLKIRSISNNLTPIKITIETRVYLKMLNNGNNTYDSHSIFLLNFIISSIFFIERKLSKEEK